MHRSEIRNTPASESVPDRVAHGVPEAARLLGITERYVWTLIDTGELKSFKLGRRRMVAREDIDTFINFLRAEDQRLRDNSRETAR